MMIYLLRHGESGSNAKDIFAAKKVDLPLTRLGIKQIEAQARILRNVGFNKIYTSPLLRAKQTAEIVGKSVGITPIISDCLCEIDVGTLDGKSMKNPYYWGIWIKTLQKWESGETEVSFPEGETLNDIGIRFDEFLEGLRDIRKPILIVSHAGFFMSVIWLYCGNHGPKLVDGHMGRGCLTIVKKNNDIFYIEKFNIEPKAICD